MKLTHLFLVTLLGIGWLAGCSKKEEPAPPAPPQGNGATRLIPVESRQKAAVLEGLTFVKGEAVTLEAGKVFVVEFWASWCPPCKVSIPHLTKIQKQFKDQGVTVIGVSNESVEVVKGFVAKQAGAMGYTVAADTGGKASAGYMKAFGQNGIPTAFIVDGSGKVAWVGHPMDGLDAALKQVVAQ